MASKKSSTSGGPKRKRKVLTLNQKVDIIKRLEEGETRKALMNEYDVGSSTIYDIRAQKDKLLSYISHSDTKQMFDKRRTLHKPKMEHLEKVLYEWFTIQKREGTPMSGPMLIEKAKDFHKQMKLTESCAFSDGWLSRFKLRHGITRLDIINRDKVAAAAVGATTAGDNEVELLWRCLPAGENGESSDLEPKSDRQSTCSNASASDHRKTDEKYIRNRPLKGENHIPVECIVQSDDVGEWVVDTNTDAQVAYIPSDSEIIDIVMHPDESSTREMDSEEERDDGKISWNDASSCLSTLIKFTEWHPAFSSREVMQLYVFKKNFTVKRQEANRKKADIRKMLQKTLMAGADNATSSSVTTSGSDIDQENE